MGRGGLLFGFVSSVVLWGGRGAADKCHWRVCREHSQCLATLGLRPLTAHVPSPSTLLRLQAALQGAGPELRALPRPEPLRFRFSGPPQGRKLSWACILCLPCPSSSGSQELDERTLFRCSATSPLPVPDSVSYWSYLVFHHPHSNWLGRTVEWPFLCEYSWFIMLCSFPVHSKVSQLYIYIYPLSLNSLPYMPLQSRFPCAKAETLLCQQRSI